MYKCSLLHFAFDIGGLTRALSGEGALARTVRALFERLVEYIDLIAAAHGSSGSCGTPTAHLDQNILGSGTCSARDSEHFFRF